MELDFIAIDDGGHFVQSRTLCGGHFVAPLYDQVLHPLWELVHCLDEVVVHPAQEAVAQAIKSVVIGVPKDGTLFQFVGCTAAAAVFIVLAVGARRAAEVPALNVPTLAGTALGAATRDPGLARRDEVTLNILAATLVSVHTGVLVEQVARSTDAALLARGGDFGADALTVPIWVGAGRQTGGQAGGVEAVVWALQSVGDTVTAAVFIFFALGP